MRIVLVLCLLATVCLADPRFHRRDDPTSTPTPTAAITTSANAAVTAIPAIPSPTQPGLSSSCISFYKVQPSDTCLSIAARYSISFAEFYFWNPSVGADCSGILAGYWVCVAVDDATPPSTTSTLTITPVVPKPTPTQPGLISTCNNFYKVAKGDTCISIVASFGYKFTVEAFEAWNPSVGADCTNMWLGYWVCVGVPGG
ncbi:uncharacterized protein BDZ99DRAFT_565066 [Mytilinidion resinicola]|uniref:LysM domain-containing protein n=1 Tax=Mytilinidion resinicola TaxID=574789 RepID=A0A6A6Z858_9PEZI|nr:uncharacterized protein BDZ99DRAFT_565066 [Mytilinidion resinicola]KAF2817301.1 hypothetical protein BDZ99DRAFT_565066 [Mytilinidion resinicola]